VAGLEVWEALLATLGGTFSVSSPSPLHPKHQNICKPSLLQQGKGPRVLRDTNGERINDSCG